MTIYEISNPFTNGLTLRMGPGVFFGKIDALASGRKGKGDLIHTYLSQMIIEGQVRAFVEDQCIHVVELDGAPADGWIAVKHLGRSYAPIAPLLTTELKVAFGVDLQGH
jgi:hypothetical protein